MPAAQAVKRRKIRRSERSAGLGWTINGMGVVDLTEYVSGEEVAGRVQGTLCAVADDGS